MTTPLEHVRDELLAILDGLGREHCNGELGIAIVLMTPDPQPHQPTGVEVLTLSNLAGDQLETAIEQLEELDPELELPVAGHA